VHALRAGQTTRIDDLRLLCSNCHRMVHARRPWLSLEGLVALLRPRGTVPGIEVPTE
jgi:5-methylcytosine-specific restriction protein A